MQDFHPDPAVTQSTVSKHWWDLSPF